MHSIITAILQYIKKHRIVIIGIIIGATGGFLYWKFIGCSSGQCPITSSPINSTLYGALMGSLLFSIGKPASRKKTEHPAKNE